MHFSVLTLFPELFGPFWDHGMIRRAIELGKISGSTIQIRDFAHGKHRTADDRPYGGGPGMVMKPEPLAGAIREARRQNSEALAILLTPQGEPFCQPMAWELAGEKNLILVCGRYEGIDERICRNFVDREISIGDYVLTGGEVAAMVIIDAVTRLIPGVLGCEGSAREDSFSEDLIEHAHYTRPAMFEQEVVPDVLLSGNHAEIEKWRLRSSLIRTFLKRRDLLLKKTFSPRELNILVQWHREMEEIIEFQREAIGRAGFEKPPINLEFSPDKDGNQDSGGNF